MSAPPKNIAILPREILYNISSWITVQEYVHLRSASKRMRSLEEIPTLVFQAYKKSTKLLGAILQHRCRMKIDLNYVDDESFMLLAKQNHSFEFRRVLESHKANQVSNCAKRRAYEYIINAEYCPYMIKALLNDNSVHPNHVVKNCFGYGTVAILWAGLKGCQDLLLYLLSDKRTNVFYRDSQGWNVSHWICSRGHVSCLQILIDDCRINFSSRTIIGSQPIHFAAYQGQEKMISMLLNQTTVDPNSQTFEGETPLHCAVISNKPRCVEMLLNDFRTMTNILNNSRKKPQDLLKYNIQNESAELILSDTRSCI
jgi:ankyrin repeat protein